MTLDTELERVVDLDPQVWADVRTALRGDEHCYSPQLAQEYPLHFCLWTEFHQKRVIFVVRKEQ
jgi:hypothetical protein